MPVILTTLVMIIFWLLALQTDIRLRYRASVLRVRELDQDKMKLLEEINFLNKTVSGQRYAMYHLSLQGRENTGDFCERYKDSSSLDVQQTELVVPSSFNNVLEQQTNVIP